jgi:hypothetical protein
MCGPTGTGSAPRGSTTRGCTSGVLESARIEAREEAGDGLEGALGSLFGVFDAGGHETRPPWLLGSIVRYELRCDREGDLLWEEERYRGQPRASYCGNRRVLERWLPCGPCECIRTGEECVHDDPCFERPKVNE